MAKFKSKLWTYCSAIGEPDNAPDSKAMLLLAVTLWLRTYDRNDPQWLGLYSLTELLVPFTNDIKLGLNVPDLPENYIVASNGVVTQAIGVPNSVRFVYVSDSFVRELDLDIYDTGRLTSTVHIKWLEWALANAILNLHLAGKPWLRDNHSRANKTIGGFTVAEFLGL